MSARLLKREKYPILSKLLLLTIAIQITSLCFLGFMFYSYSSNTLLGLYEEKLENENTKIADYLNDKIATIITSSYTIGTNRYINDAGRKYAASKDMSSFVELNTIINETLNEIRYANRSLVKYMTYLIDGNTFFPSQYILDYRKLNADYKRFADSTLGYMTFLPIQDGYSITGNDKVLPIVFHYETQGSQIKDSYLVAFIDLDLISTMLTERFRFDNLILKTPQGQILFSRCPNIKDTDEPFVKTDEGAEKKFRLSGEYYYYNKKDIPISNWSSLLFINQNVFLSPARRMFLVLTAILTVTFAIQIAILVIVYKKMTTPIIELVDIMSRPIDEKSGYQRFQYDRLDEIGILSEAYNRMIEKNEQLIDSLNRNIIALNRKNEQLAREQEQAKRSEIKALQEQINPHFLYNTLNTIIWFSIEQKAYKSADLTKDLATYYRIGLSRGKEEIPLQEEIEHASTYLKIQQYRYSEILSYRINVNSRFNDYHVPKIILQPLVENALYHGLKPLMKKGEISITSYSNSKNLMIVIRNTGVLMEQHEMTIINKNLSKSTIDSASGYGIYNVNLRLKLKYGTESGLHYYVCGGSTCVRITIPHERGQND